MKMLGNLFLYRTMSVQFGHYTAREQLFHFIGQNKNDETRIILDKNED